MRRRSLRLVAADDNDDEEEEEEDEDEEAVDAAALRSEDGEGDKKEELELGPTAAAADGGLMQLSKADALLEYQGDLRRRLGLGQSVPRLGLNHLLLGRAGGGPALHTPSRLEVMAGIGCHRLPDTLGGALDQFHASLFSAVFNRASSMVSVACQDGKISLFDTEQLLFRAAAPPTAAAASSDRGPPRPPLRPVKEIQCQDVGWSIIGSAFAPDGKWIAYSSWSRYLHLANTWGEHCLHEPYLVSQSRSRHFCLFSLAFSSDGTRVVGGGNDGGIHVVNLERKTTRVVEDAHDEDVNTVCFLFPEQDSLLLSGSDDGLVKLWDLRALSSDRAQGLCAGHAHGITSLSTKGNGVHVLSNSKDQSAKLWDLRRLRDASPEATSRASVDPEWDYRWDSGAAPFSSSARRRGSGQDVEDTSLLTFRGHRVARTLIQAVFSPGATTGGRFVLSGSADGGVVVYDTLQSPPEGEGRAGSATVVRPMRRMGFHRDCVRTVACAPHHDLLLSSSWDHRLGLWRFQGKPNDEK